MDVSLGGSWAGAEEILTKMGERGKSMQMGSERWVKKMYLAGRREFRTNPTVKNWYSVTKSWMSEVGLGEYWDRVCRFGEI